MIRNKTCRMNHRGLSFVEVMVAMSIFLIVGTAGMMLFTSGSSMWSVTGSKIELQQNLRQAGQRVSLELQESGRNSADVLQVNILNNAGLNATDILRFAVPICVCGQGIIDDNGEVRAWGAPSTWGRSGCSEPLTINNNGKVTICHLPPGNPGNSQTLSVAPSAIKAHLAHGDWIGSCDSCNPNTYTNRQIEYRVDANRRLLRRILDSGGNAIDSDVVAQNITDFQATLSAGQNMVTIVIEGTRLASQNRVIELSRSMEVILRNY